MRKLLKEGKEKLGNKNSSHHNEYHIKGTFGGGNLVNDHTFAPTKFSHQTV